MNGYEPLQFSGIPSERIRTLPASDTVFLWVACEYANPCNPTYFVQLPIYNRLTAGVASLGYGSLRFYATREEALQDLAQAMMGAT